jgi:hypothetical protein
MELTRAEFGVVVTGSIAVALHGLSLARHVFGVDADVTVLAYLFSLLLLPFAVQVARERLGTGE